jgi:hypothetical protein
MVLAKKTFRLDLFGFGWIWSDLLGIGRINPGEPGGR